MTPARNRSAKRPFRIWDARAKRLVAYRCYVHEKTAREGLAKVVYWAGHRSAFELYNIQTGKLIDQGGRRASGAPWGLGGGGL